MVATTKITRKITRRKTAAYNIKYLLFKERERERERKRERKRERTREYITRCLVYEQKEKNEHEQYSFTAIYLYITSYILFSRTIHSYF